VTTAGSTPDVRVARRRALAYARLAELREGVWMRPDNLPVQLPAELAAQVEVMTARPGEPDRLAGAMWDLHGWADRAHALRDAMATLTPDRVVAWAPGFELSAAVLRHLQADPLLPEELLPAGWPGMGLRAEYDRWDMQYRATLREWSRA
jgi:phenylacetic acid degradation operon negative regulatory protein